MLSPFLFTLYTFDCVSCFDVNIVLTFSANAMVLGKLRGSNESSYDQDIENQISWCRDNNLQLNIGRTMENITNYRKVREVSYEPVVIDGMEVERVEEFSFLGTIIKDDLLYTGHISHLVGKAHQRWYFLIKL